MGAPKVSRAIFTMSIARTTPAQKPLGLSNKTLFWLGEVPAALSLGMDSRTDVVTSVSIPSDSMKRHRETGQGSLYRQGRTHPPKRQPQRTAQITRPPCWR